MRRERLRVEDHARVPLLVPVARTDWGVPCGGGAIAESGCDEGSGERPWVVEDESGERRVVGATGEGVPYEAVHAAAESTSEIALAHCGDVGAGSAMGNVAEDTASREDAVVNTRVSPSPCSSSCGCAERQGVRSVGVGSGSNDVCLIAESGKEVG